MHKTHRLQLRVYYENTDAGGIVYHADYLNFAERGRTEFLRDHRITSAMLLEKENLIFVVTQLNIQFKKAAKLDDLLTVETSIKRFSDFRITFTQSILNQSGHCALLEVEVVGIHAQTLKPLRVPSSIAKLIL